MSEEEFSVGRAVGGATKRYPEVTEKLKELRKITKKKSSDIIKEALEIYELYSLFRDIDPKSFTAAISFINYMLKTSVELVASMIPILGSGFMRSYFESVKEFITPEEKEKSKEVDEMISTLRLTLLSTVINMLQSLTPSLSTQPRKLEGVKVREH